MNTASLYTYILYIHKYTSHLYLALATMNPRFIFFSLNRKTCFPDRQSWRPHSNWPHLQWAVRPCRGSKGSRHSASICCSRTGFEIFEQLGFLIQNYWEITKLVEWNFWVQLRLVIFPTILYNLIHPFNQEYHCMGVTQKGLNTWPSCFFKKQKIVAHE